MCSWEQPIGFSIIPLSVCYISSKTRLSSFVSQTLPLEAKTLLISSRPLLKLEESLLMYSIPPPTNTTKAFMFIVCHSTGKCGIPQKNTTSKE